MENLKFDTLSLHAGYRADPSTRSRAVPLYMTTAYTFDSTEASRAVFALEQSGNIYTRIGNPTCDVLENRLAALEGGIAGLAASSGHGAMYMTFLCLCSQGDEIVSSRDIYGGAVNMMGKTLAQSGITVHFVDSGDPDNFARATNENTKAYFVETIGNPHADLPDLRAISDIAKKNGIPLIADNTIATPYLLKPIDLGADIVIHSCSKYLSGNGTIIGGCVVDAGKFTWKDNPRFPAFNTPDESYHGLVYADLGEPAFIVKLRTHILRDIGATMSPFNAWVTLHGMETLSLRMQKTCANGRAVAEFLSSHPKVAKVSYPALPGSKHKAVCDKYFPKGCGATFTFDIKGGREECARFCDSLEMIQIMANLGDSVSMCVCPSVTTHSQLSDDQLKASGLSPGTIRLSVGIEDESDIICDISSALDKV